MKKEDELQSSAEPQKKSAPKKKKETEKKEKIPFKDYTIHDTETAKKRGRNGGIKSGEVRRAKRDARETIRYMLEQCTKSDTIKSNLLEVGFKKEDLTNQAALQGRLFTLAMGGNLEAYMLLMKMGGYEPEENRKERESVASDRRRDMEVEAKINALGMDSAELAVNVGDEDGNSDVVVYIPRMKTEEECAASDEETDVKKDE